MYDPMLKHMPRNIQELHNPKLKRERLADEKLRRVMSNIVRKYSLDVGIINIRNMREKDLEDVVIKLMDNGDRETKIYLHQILRGNYPKLSEMVYKNINK